jgi:hypothetical protein
VVAWEKERPILAHGRRALRSRAWVRDLTRDEEFAVCQYSGDARGCEVNGRLRSGIVLPQDGDFLRHMDSALEKSSTSEPLTLSRPAAEGLRRCAIFVEALTFSLGALVGLFVPSPRTGTGSGGGG